MIEVENVMTDILKTVKDRKTPLQKRIEMNSLLVDMLEHYRSWLENSGRKYPKEPYSMKRENEKFKIEI